jgi:hypothetical protein
MSTFIGPQVVRLYPPTALFGRHFDAVEQKLARPNETVGIENQCLVNVLLYGNELRNDKPWGIRRMQ